MSRSLFLIILFTVVGCRLLAQPVKYEGGSKIYEKAENQPEFPGGDAAFKEYTRHPFDNGLRDYNCGALLSCVIEKDGSLTKVKVLVSGGDRECTAQSIKLLTHSPKWSPGLIDGKPVRVRLKLNININYSAPDFASNIPHKKNFIYTSVEKTPNYPGGREGFGTYIKNNIKYPDLALKNGTEGRVIVTFVVERNGKLTDVKIARGIGDGCDEEAVRLVQKTSKKWTPGKMGDTKVRTAFAIPVDFAIPDSSN